MVVISYCIVTVVDVLTCDYYANAGYRTVPPHSSIISGDKTA
jgi:hypothetical protein